MEPNADHSRLDLGSNQSAEDGRTDSASGDRVPGQARLGWLGRWLGGWPTDGWHRRDGSRAGSHDGGWLGAPDSYWRRRFFILVGGLVVLGAVTWGLSALVGSAKPLAAARAAAQASLSARNTLPVQAYGSPVIPSPTSASPSPSLATSPGTVSATGVPGSTSPSPSTLAPSQSPSPSAGVAGTCSPKSIVLSLFTSQSSFGPGQQPTFSVYAVSTAPGTCQLSYGPSLVRVVVTWKGQVMWDSAACASSGKAAKPVTFTQGVPQVAILQWNRQSTSQGCAGSVPAGTSGTFEAVALAVGKSSPVHSFTLSR